jgi:hypothetical protein
VSTPGPVTADAYRDRVRRALQDGQTTDGETLAVAFLEDLSDQVQMQATPTAVQFQIRFTATPTQGLVPVTAVPGTLVAFVDTNPAPVTPTVDVDTNAVFTLPSPPMNTLQVTYAYQYFQDASLDAYVDEARSWVGGINVLDNVTEIPPGLDVATIDYAASRALRALAARYTHAVSAHAGDSEMDFSDMAKAAILAATSKEKTATSARDDYWSRSGQQGAPFASVDTFRIPQYQPRR